MSFKDVEPKDVNALNRLAESNQHEAQRSVACPVISLRSKEQFLGSSLLALYSNASRIVFQ